MNENETHSRLLTVTEVAERLRISPGTAYRHCASGVLPAIKLGGAIRVDEDDLQDLLRPRDHDDHPNPA